MYGRSWVRFPSGTQIFSLSHARDMLNIEIVVFFEALVMEGEIGFLATRNKISYVEDSRQS